MAEEKEKVKEKEKKEQYEIIEVPTETTLVIRNNQDESLNDQLAILKIIANDIAEIKKRVS